VAVVNLAIGPRTFPPSIYGKLATALYILTGVAALYFNYLGEPSLLVQALIWVSLAITFISAAHYAMQVARMPH
jgi:phosphatidylglycerophosphate synthase